MYSPLVETNGTTDFEVYKNVIALATDSGIELRDKLGGYPLLQDRLENSYPFSKVKMNSIHLAGNRIICLFS